MKVIVKIEHEDMTYEASYLDKGALHDTYASDIADVAASLAYGLFSELFYDFVKEPESRRRAREVQNDENIKDFDNEDK